MIFSVTVTVCAAPDAGVIVIVPVYWPTAIPPQLMIAVSVAGVLPCCGLITSHGPPLFVVAEAVNAIEVVPLASAMACREIAGPLEAV